ncbi:hypothetical protein EIN_095090 [Entamoeba invadens IP1]|uniref:Phosphoglycolate phosphatase n=1 Tax=Entamoeba invadens IP1 TaxID=370355 RepID=A0A0A1U060_ENTIV|nr:hypothetical protein EIN_095090 [Entamoeba invadens IP1]ELP87272.1 hypothetical protein EIN_095090 [Entamoeba invadens IP1]|eukprot:XP_004254043.1 hypothetical protein EIN_095090 [Entamoeba invadens IP1]
MNSRFKCLVIDHDDTSVDSTPKINYPCYLSFMREYAPSIPPASLTSFQNYLFDIGITKYYKDVARLPDHLIKYEAEYWQAYADSHDPPDFFPGFLDVLKHFKQLGGLVVVVSYCDKNNIARAYTKAGSFLPDKIFGCDSHNPKLSKPHKELLVSIMREFNLRENEIVVIDDMSDGFRMADHFKGITKVGVTYGDGHEDIKDKMKGMCHFVATSVKELNDFIFM